MTMYVYEIISYLKVWQIHKQDQSSAREKSVFKSMSHAFDEHGLEKEIIEF